MPLNEGDLTSHLEPTDSRTENKNGVQDCCDFIKIQATNGVVLNGLPLWADIERKLQPKIFGKLKLFPNLIRMKFQKERLNCGGYVASLLSENW